MKQAFNVSTVPRLAITTGFTLVELMVVVVILTIFAGMMSLSVGSSDSRKNKAFYEQLIHSLSYVRLLSAENMQPMGLVLQADSQGQVQPAVLKLDNPYSAYGRVGNAIHSVGNGAGADSVAKNSMELTDMPSTFDKHIGQDNRLPTWTLADEVKMPQLPKDVQITIVPLDHSATNLQQSAKTLQPWFKGNDVPKALWFGTGSAAPARIEVRYNERLVGDAIMISPDGRLVIGQDR